MQVQLIRDIEIGPNREHCSNDLYCREHGEAVSDNHWGDLSDIMYRFEHDIPLRNGQWFFISKQHISRHGNLLAKYKDPRL